MSFAQLSVSNRGVHRHGNTNNVRQINKLLIHSNDLRVYIVIFSFSPTYSCDVSTYVVVYGCLILENF